MTSKNNMVTKRVSKKECLNSFIHCYTYNDVVTNLFSRGLIELQGGYKI